MHPAPRRSWEIVGGERNFKSTDRRKEGRRIPRPSPYGIELTDDERRQLEENARAYTSSYCMVIRAKIVLLAAEGLRNDEIATRLDTPRQIVSKWRKRFYERRMDGLVDLPRAGRPAGAPRPEEVLSGRLSHKE